MAAGLRFGYAPPMEPRLARHLAACNNTELPGRRRPFAIGPIDVGWVTPEAASALADFTGITTAAGRVTLAEDAAADLPAIARALTSRGFGRWRGEAFDVRTNRDGPVLSTIDRGAIPVFGILAFGVHVNGLVRSPDGPRLWVARRAADRALDPGKLDHIVAGGVAAGMTPRETVIKEAAEEAAIPAPLAATALETSTVSYAMERPEGLRRDHLICYDLDLPPDFTPAANDGEVAGFELWPLSRVLERVRDSDDFKFNVNLVLIDLFRRLGMV